MQEQLDRNGIKSLTFRLMRSLQAVCYNPEVVEVRMGLCVSATPLHFSPHTALGYVYVRGKENIKERLHELSEFAFPILFYSLSCYISEQITIPNRWVLTLPHLRACPPPARSLIVQNACRL